MTGKARAALYVRVSAPDQKSDLQHDGLRAYAERAGLRIVGDYCDHAVSGRRQGRPQFNALMTSARNREIDCGLVRKFDQFARSARHLLTALEEFDHLGVRYISVQDQVDTASPMGRAMFTIIAAIGGSERGQAAAGSAKSRSRSDPLPNRSPDRPFADVRAADRFGSTEPPTQKPMSSHVPLCR